MDSGVVYNPLSAYPHIVHKGSSGTKILRYSARGVGRGGYALHRRWRRIWVGLRKRLHANTEDHSKTRGVSQSGENLTRPFLRGAECIADTRCAGGMHYGGVRVSAYPHVVHKAALGTKSYALPRSPVYIIEATGKLSLRCDR
jgi:hypothetical protein